MIKHLDGCDDKLTLTRSFNIKQKKVCFTTMGHKVYIQRFVIIGISVLGYSDVKTTCNTIYHSNVSLD